MIPKALHAFCLIVRRGSLAGAALDLNLSQPAVSRLISNLEKEVGFQLFQRDRRTLRPTEEARLFYRDVERILAGLEQLSGIAEDIRQGAGRKVRVVALTRLANSILPIATKEFREHMPDVGVVIETHHRREMERWLTGHHFDVGFGPLPVEQMQLDIRPLGSKSAVAVLGPDHPLRQNDAISVDDLINEPLISLTPDTLLQQQINAIFSEAGKTPRPVLSTSSSLVAANLASQGLGYTITDPFTAFSISRPATVRKITPEFSMKYGVLTPAGAVSLPTTDLFVECMIRAFEEFGGTL
ncbi:LysR family transcriptional regulator [Litoreibacter roseus]|uniref:LysR family transcriptional regulator n=1 Tax=Litoreibacter roseus TaxID=2601869 RepID=A0A6N6JBN6_9RHOB|nr:LysR family transcriptional regulator [Litoreibacter roseus]GFE63407.1 LysR family transcriptional regulator [Litoreibacter roseus]